MSAVFTQPSDNQRLVLGSNPITTGNPFTIVVWVKPTTNTRTQVAFGIGSSAGGGDSYVLAPWDDTNAYFQADNDFGTSRQNADVGTTYAANTWQVLIGTSSGASNRQGYLGSSTGGANTNAITLDGLDRLVVGGRFAAGNFYDTFIGRVAHVTVWDSVLSAPNLASLLTDLPSTVNSGDIVLYESLKTGAGSLTNTGSVTFDSEDHPIDPVVPVPTIVIDYGRFPKHKLAYTPRA
jgi:hypothetical protein